MTNTNTIKISKDDLLKINWVEVDFFPKNDKAWEEFVDEYIEFQGLDEDDYIDRGYYDRDCFEEHSHTVYIDKMSLHKLDTFVESANELYFNEDLNMTWRINNDEINIEHLQEHHIKFTYDEIKGWINATPILPFLQSLSLKTPNKIN